MAVLNSPEYYYAAISELNQHSSNSSIIDLSNNIVDDTNIVNFNITLTRSQVETLSLDNETYVYGSFVENGISNEDKIATSTGMYDDSRNLYITKLLENYLLFISICGISYGIYKSNRSG